MSKGPRVRTRLERRKLSKKQNLTFNSTSTTASRAKTEDLQQLLDKEAENLRVKEWIKAYDLGWKEQIVREYALAATTLARLKGLTSSDSPLSG